MRFQSLAVSAGVLALAVAAVAGGLVGCQTLGTDAPEKPDSTTARAPRAPETPMPAMAPHKNYSGPRTSRALAGGGGGGGRGRGGGPGGGGGGYQDNGQAGTEISIMSQHGWNAFRLRVFVSPVRAAPNNSLENTIALAKQIKAANAMFLLDIHYSDTWADPQHQEIPVAWRNLDVAGLENQVEAYSKDVITQLKAAGAMPDMVQVGNEITGGTLWPLGHVKVPQSKVKNDAGAIRPLPDPYDDVGAVVQLHAIHQGGNPRREDGRGRHAGADGYPY